MTESDDIKNWTILVIDDNHDNRTLIADILRLSGITVYEAASGPDGLHRLETITPTVVLLDIRMPGMDGWKVLNEIRNNPQTAKLKVVALTTHDRPPDFEESGFDAFFQKPIQVHELLDKLHQLIKKPT